MIRVEGIRKFYKGRPVLTDVDLTIPEGTNVGLIGPGGSGKSLLLKVICGLVKPEAGRVFIGDTDVHALDPTALADLRFGIGMLFQNYALFDFMNCFDNIAFPLRQEGQMSEAEVDERVDAILDEVSLPHVGPLFPNALSGGMKKRISFARAIIREPPLIFYDDPTAGLDPVTSSKIFTLLRNMQVRQKATSVTVTHDIEGIKEICDTFVMLDQGRVVFCGTRNEIEASEVTLVRQFWDGFSDDKIGHGD